MSVTYIDCWQPGCVNTRYKLLIVAETCAKQFGGNYEPKSLVFAMSNYFAPTTVNELLQDIAYAAFTVFERVTELFEC